uniref:Uncharacterized protein n=1 Tax=Aegilops tauschii subsp. strangulata TaxID=200361 RepID=A0A453D2X5_AEGTS
LLDTHTPLPLKKRKNSTSSNFFLRGHSTSSREYNAGPYFLLLCFLF